MGGEMRSEGMCDLPWNRIKQQDADMIGAM